MKCSVHGEVGNDWTISDECGRCARSRMDVKRNAFDLLVRAPSTPHKITYRRADNELICGEFDYVEQLEYFENDDEPTKLIKETWLLVKSEVFTVRPTGWSEDEDE